MFRFGSIKRSVFSTSKALAKNTTQMGGDFLSNLKGLALLLRYEHEITFAAEMRQKHAGSWIKNDWKQ